MNWWNCIDQWQQLCDIVNVCVGQDCCEWCVIGVGDDVVFRIWLCVIGGVWFSFWFVLMV